ncbi:MAG: hypothetical protein QOG44_1973 [Acidimicrobiaceae bacterium]|nr:hypothetical protein [Acidimicrobiaceae bacterium]
MRRLRPRVGLRVRPWLELVAVVLLASMTATVATTRPAAALSRLRTLVIGGGRTMAQPLDINVVFVGFPLGAGPGQVDLRAFRAELPTESDSVVRWPLNYGRVVPVGTNFPLRYHPTVAPANFDDRFFAYLSSIATPHPLTRYQQLYNGQAARSTTLTANSWIDAPSVERWLGDHARTDLGVDPRQDTLFFIDWYGRPDFKFHVFTVTNSPDPDTGVNTGLVSDRAKVAAWGGTYTPGHESRDGTRRVWFDDVSAGPDYASGGWDLADRDVDGDGYLDYRIPPVWEYRNTAAYRPFTSLSSDLGKLARYVATDELFVASPLYSPRLPSSTIPSSVEIDVNTFADTATPTAALLKPDVVAAREQALQPYNEFSVQVHPQPVPGPGLDAYKCWLTAYLDPAGVGTTCYPGRSPYGTAAEDLLFYQQDHHSQLTTGQHDFAIPVLLYNIPDDLAPAGPYGAISGLTDDDWTTGTQTYVFAMTWPSLRAGSWFGATQEVTHEVGHFLGLPHPHDGVDNQQRIMFLSTGPFFFVRAGDAVQSPMSYLNVAHDFGQFDRDVLDRSMTAAYLNAAGALLAPIISRRESTRDDIAITEADYAATRAVRSFADMNYTTAATEAKAAYQQILTVAQGLGVSTTVAPIVPKAVASVNGYSSTPGKPSPRLDPAASVDDPW